MTSEHPYTVHGHTLVWNDDEHTLPDLVGEEDAEAIRQRLREHVREQMGDLAGDVHEWDVINHPFWGNDIRVEHLDSNREDWVDWLATASEADPEAKLFVNEEATRDQPSIRENDRQYREMIEYLVERDAELDGAGFIISPPDADTRTAGVRPRTVVTGERPGSGLVAV